MNIVNISGSKRRNKMKHATVVMLNTKNCIKSHSVVFPLCADKHRERQISPMYRHKPSRITYRGLEQVKLNQSLVNSWIIIVLHFFEKRPSAHLSEEDLMRFVTSAG